MTTPNGIIGWDIGGVNTKAVRLAAGAEPAGQRIACIPFQVQEEPGGLPSVLSAAALEIGAGPGDRHAITMTAELSQAFRTKREGVGSILDAVETAFPDAELHVYSVDGRFLEPAQARRYPWSVGASNWVATASWLARTIPTCVLVDIGTTSTDLIPIIDGRVAAEGRTDPERLSSGELIYSGALRTPAEAVARQVPLWGRTATVSADGFALIGDAHLWLGNVSDEEYTCPAPDNRPRNRVFAGERLARIVCADREMLDEAAIGAIAAALARAQVRTVSLALERLRRRWPAIELAVVTGLGDFIAAEAAQAAGFDVVSLETRLGAAARIAPAFAVACLLREQVGS
jgi:(4-(4-[2-(gamma-L-glutamylamino)ethyl]phenoxymethyl)furan-2-yl)methanamine synthase